MSNANDGTRIGGTSTNGKVDKALCFNGTGDHVAVPDDPEVNLPGAGSSASDFSIDFWIKTTGQDLQVILDKREGPIARGYHVFLFNGRPGIQLADASGPSNICSNSPTSSCTNFLAPASVNVATGNWEFVAITVARQSPTGGRIYVGNQLKHVFDPTLRPGNLSNTAPLLIGKRQPAFGELFLNGCLDELEMFERELLATEVDKLFAAGSYGKCKRKT